MIYLLYVRSQILKKKLLQLIIILVHYKTGNVQTGVPGLGKYDEILSKFDE
ncbi:hypothetical protein ACE5D9_03005 [Rickettsia sp. 2024-CO-Wats]|uniref:hypothetical protein n=1 Tax=unclassified Rickettsia TaxID=114295 RepID=UPI00370D58AC